jgi:hypothetical protein
MRLRNWSLGGLTLTAVLFMSALAYAHHGMSSFDTNSPITLTGTVTNVEWINPHVIVQMDVRDAGGKVEAWLVQAGSPNAMLRRGLIVQTLKPGVLLAVAGYPPRAGVTLDITSGADLIKSGHMVYSYDVNLVRRDAANPK